MRMPEGSQLRQIPSLCVGFILRNSNLLSTSLLRLRLGLGLGLRLPVPFERARQAILKSDRRLVPEKISRLRNVRLRVADVPIPCWFVLGFQGLAGDLRERAQDFIEGDA